MCLERTSLDNAAQTRIFYIRQLANRRANTAQTYDKAAHSPKHCSRYGVGWNGKNSFKNSGSESWSGTPPNVTVYCWSHIPSLEMITSKLLKIVDDVFKLSCWQTNRQMRKHNLIGGDNETWKERDVLTVTFHCCFERSINVLCF